MIKDRILKIKLLRYFLLNFWYTDLEVNIMSKERISKNKKLITDVDVLALYPDATGDLKMYLGDCKTLKNQSPIARGLWMKGLMEYFGAAKGLILLLKDIEKEHQLSVYPLNVQIFSESDFETYSKRTADYLIEMKCALAEEEIWDEFFKVAAKFPKLLPLHDYARTVFWNEPNSRQQLRTGIYYLRVNKGELNPATSIHLAITLNHISLVAISLNNIIINIFNKYLVPSSKEELDNDLKVLIYGGIENYDFLNDLRKKFATTSVDELALPDWLSFLELVRAILEKPLAFNVVPLFLKEIAFGFMSAAPETYNYANTIARKSPYICTFAVRFVEYMCKACGLPPEFRETYATEIVKTT